MHAMSWPGCRALSSLAIMSSKPRTAFTGVPSDAVMLSGGIPKNARKYKDAESSSISGAIFAILPEEAIPDLRAAGLAKVADHLLLALVRLLFPDRLARSGGDEADPLVKGPGPGVDFRHPKAEGTGALLPRMVGHGIDQPLGEAGPPGVRLDPHADELPGPWHGELIIRVVDLARGRAGGRGIQESQERGRGW